MNLARSTAPPPETGAAAMAPPHIDFLGLRFCLLPRPQVVRLVLGAGNAPYRYVVTPNAYHVVEVHDDPATLLPIYRGAWLSLCDSRIVQALAKLDGHSLPLVTGSDLVAALLSALDASDSGRALRLLIVGPSREAERPLRVAFPGATFDIMPAPAGLAQNAELRLSVARACMERRWDMLMLCVGCPAQELIARQLGELGCSSGVALCVGAAIDFLTGARVRAPRWLQTLGLEWAYRLIREPRRLWRRYLVESPKILRIFLATRSSRRR